MRGRDKLMEDVDGMPLLRRTVLRAQATGEAIVVTLPPATHPRYTALKGLDVLKVPVTDAALGLSASLRAGLGALPAGCVAVMVMLADMPDLTTDDLNTIMQAVDLKSETLIWRATTYDGAAGHPTVFHASLFSELMALEGDKGAKPMIEKYRSRTLLIPLPDAHARTDLDTPEAWDAWREAQQST